MSRMALVRTAALAAPFVAALGVAHAAEPYGTWMRPSTGTHVQFYNCGGKLCAKIVAVKEAARKHEIGTVIMHGATKTAAGKWEGDLFDIDSGRTYSGVVTLEGANALNLKGCVLVICRGETWKRVK